MKWTLLEDADAVARTAAERVLTAAQKAVSRRGIFRVVLAGGSTPERCYQLLSHAPGEWSRWHVYFGDERCLSPDDPRRNSRMADRALTGKVPIPAAQIYPIPAELGPEKAALRYTELVREAVPFDLVLLGLGEDGHTASLFPGHAHGEGLVAIPVYQAPKPPAERVSLSPAALTECRQLLFLATGRSKRRALDDWRAGDDFPAARIAAAGNSEILVDRAAWGNPHEPGESQHQEIARNPPVV